MKKGLLFGLALIFVAQVFAQDADPYIVKNFPGVRKVEASTSGGNISVMGGNVSQATVEVIITASNYNKSISKDEIKAKLEKDYSLKMEMNGDVLVLEARRKTSGNYNNGLSISFRVTLPNKTSSDLTTSGGNISVKELDGNQELATSGGNLVVKRVKGKIKGVTSGGNIVAEELKDDVDLSTSGGNVTAKSCSGKIKLTTSGGNMSMEDMDGNITASTSGGNVDGEKLSGEISAGTSGGNVDLEHIRGSVKAGTSGGSMLVSVDEIGKYVKLTNSGGKIDLSLPAGKGYDLDIRGSKVNTTALSNYSGTMSEGKLNGKINGGGIPVTVDNSGKVDLSFNN